MLVSVPDGATVDSVLVPDGRTVKGFAGPSLEALDAYISLGTPTFAELTPGDGTTDPEVAAFLKGDVRNQYYFVRLACTFHPAGAQRFEKAWLEITLAASDPASDQPPIALSMDPQRVAGSAERSLGAELGVTLGILSIKGNADDKVSRDLVSLEALNELQSDPAWEFKRTAARELTGSQRLAMIVKAKRGTTTLGTVSLKATVPYRDVFVTYQAFFKQQPQLTFTMP